MTKRWVSLAVLTATVGLLGLVTAAQAEVRVGPNYKLDSDSSPFRGRDQVSLAVRPGNPQHVVQVNANYLELTCESSVSFDGGETWSTAVPLSLPAPAMGESPFRPSCSSFQSVEFGTGQNVYATATAARTTPAFPDSSTLVFRSTDGGLTWQPGVVALASGPGRTATTDPTTGPSYFRPSLSVQAGAGTNGADRIYAVALDTNGSDVRAAVSDNGGQTFSAGVNVNPAATDVTDNPSKPAVFADGSVTVSWRTTGREGLLQASRSTDRGQNWSAPVDIAKVTNTGTPVPSHVPTVPPETGASASASYPRMAADPASGNLYLVYHQGSTGPTAPAGGFLGADHFINPDGAVYFQRSLDKGATWSTPKLISERATPPGTQMVQTRHPTISISPNGRINIVWHDRRHWYQGPGERTCSHSHIFCEDVRLGDTYYSYSTNAGATFSPNIRVSDRSLNNEVGYDGKSSSTYWNFGPQSVTVGGGKLLIGWMDSREGNWDTDTQDTYLAKVDFDATGTAPQTNIDQPDAVSRSVALSKLGYQAGNEGALVGGPRDPAGAGPSGPASRNDSTVVIVNENDVAGALAGQVLGRANPAPVLLSPPSGLPTSVKAEVSRMSPAGAFVIGDAAKLSEQVITDLAAAGVPSGQITRVSGANDAATAALIAARMDERLPAEQTANSPAFDAAVIANPASPDAAAVAGLAAARRLPILYVGANSVPQETTDALASLDINKTLVIGGPSSVSDTVLGPLPSPTRLGGADQYGTSQAVVTESKARGLPGNVVYVADGSQPMDAALLGGVAARATGMLVLAPAPLYTTATGQASSFGLSGIARFFLLGPPTPVAPPPPPSGGNGGGGSPPAPPLPPPATVPPLVPALDRVAPTMTAKLTNARFRLGPSRTPTIAAKKKKKTKRAPVGTTFQVTLSEPAAFTIRISRVTNGVKKGKKCVKPPKKTKKGMKPKKCMLLTTAGTLTRRTGKQGRNDVAFSGRIASKALARGTYRAEIAAADAAGNRSKPKTLSFTIVK